MKIEKGRIYQKRDSNQYQMNNEAEVAEVKGDRVNYREITGWSYGFPAFGHTRSMTRANFEAAYQDVSHRLAGL